MQLFTWEDDKVRTFGLARRRFVRKCGCVPNRLGIRGEDGEDTEDMGIAVVSGVTLPPGHFFLWREDEEGV